MSMHGAGQATQVVEIVDRIRLDEHSGRFTAVLYGRAAAAGSAWDLVI
jgi:hypothetical protein